MPSSERERRTRWRSFCVSRGPKTLQNGSIVLSGDDRQRIVVPSTTRPAGTVLTDTTASIRAQLVDDINPERLARIAEAMPPDDAADLIGELEVERIGGGFQHISSADEEVLRQLLTYPEDTAGGIMHPEAVALQPAETVDDAIQVLRYGR